MQNCFKIKAWQNSKFQYRMMQELTHWMTVWGLYCDQLCNVTCCYALLQKNSHTATKKKGIGSDWSSKLFNSWNIQYVKPFFSAAQKFLLQQLVSDLPVDAHFLRRIHKRIMILLQKQNHSDTSVKPLKNPEEYAGFMKTSGVGWKQQHFQGNGKTTWLIHV